MRSKSILFVLAVCMGMQCGVSFGAQETAQAQSWSNWLSSGAGKAWSAAKRAPGRVVEAAKSNLSESWSDSKKETDFISPSRSAYQAGHAAALMAHMLLNSPHGALAFIFPEVITEQMQAIDPNYAGKLVLASGAGAFIYTYVMQKAVAYYRAQDITREQAVSQVKDAISFVLSDSMAYPTRLSKIHALLKKNEFIGVDMLDEDGIVAQACNDLIGDISKVSYDKKHDEPIDKEIDAINSSLLGISSLEMRLQYVKDAPLPQNLNNDSTFADLMKILSDLGVKATMSVMLRLQKQLLFESAHPALSQSDLRGDVARAYEEEKLEIQKKYSESGKVLGGKRQITSGERVNHLKRLKEKRAARAAQPGVKE